MTGVVHELMDVPITTENRSGALIYTNKIEQNQRKEYCAGEPHGRARNRKINGDNLVPPRFRRSHYIIPSRDFASQFNEVQMGFGSDC